MKKKDGGTKRNDFQRGRVSGDPKKEVTDGQRTVRGAQAEKNGDSKSNGQRFHKEQPPHLLICGHPSKDVSRLLHFCTYKQKVSHL